MRSTILVRPTVAEVVNTLKLYNQSLRVVLNNKDVEFMISEDAAVSPESKDQQFTQFLFIDPLRIVPVELRPKSR